MAAVGEGAVESAWELLDEMYTEASLDIPFSRFEGRAGLTSYLSFLAFISISLGVINLLPIPILDGGHFIYHLIELICRRPLSEKSKIKGFYIGFILIVMLLFIAVFNDFSRLLGINQ